jgi:hypothetical protein
VKQTGFPRVTARIEIEEGRMDGGYRESYFIEGSSIFRHVWLFILDTIFIL